jgi:hypothetical protein
MSFAISSTVDEDTSWVLGGVGVFGVDCSGLNRPGFGAPGGLQSFGGFMIGVRGFLAAMETSAMIIPTLKDCASSTYPYPFPFFYVWREGGFSKKK